MIRTLQMASYARPHPDGADPARILAALSLSAHENPTVYLDAARRTLQTLVARADLLDSLDLERRPGGYTRNLLFGGGGISVWAMVWSPGARTSVHDHHCSCCFGVWKGAIREVWFRPLGASEAVATADATRAQGYVACMLPSGPNLHQIVNSGPEEAISIHVYGFDHAVHASSVRREYRIVSA
jgi:predicted metal-dependent enzyme (double-stranded beta helix superfamily)